MAPYTMHDTAITKSNTISSMNIRVSELAASIVAKISSTKENQTQLIELGCVPLLVYFLDINFSSNPRIQESALDALAGLCKDNLEGSQILLNSKSDSGERAFSALLRFCRDKLTTLRLLSCAW